MTLAEILVVMIVNLLPSIKKTTNLPPLLTNIYSISIRYPSYRELYMYIRKEQLHTNMLIHGGLKYVSYIKH